MASNRHLSRIVAMQTLYEWDFRFQKKSPKSKEDIKHLDKIAKILERNTEEFASSIDDTKFISDLVNGVLENVVEIDKIIAPAAPEWPIEQIAIIDREILRLGIYELLFAREVPPKVAINEAVELAKNFGGENSSKFVNGVLGTVYRSSDIYEEETTETPFDSAQGRQNPAAAGTLETQKGTSDTESTEKNVESADRTTKAGDAEKIAEDTEKKDQDKEEFKNGKEEKSS